MTFPKMYHRISALKKSCHSTGLCLPCLVSIFESYAILTLGSHCIVIDYFSVSVSSTFVSHAYWNAQCTTGIIIPTYLSYISCRGIIIGKPQKLFLSSRSTSTHGLLEKEIFGNSNRNNAIRNHLQ